MGRRFLPLGACAALLVGCGGGGEAAPERPFYARTATIACLKKKDFRILTRSKAVGFVAYTAVGGGFRARQGKSDVIMAFGADTDDAAQTLTMIRRSPELRHSAIFRYRTRRANVAILWAYRPTAKQKKTVYGCLKPAAA
jgi:hypothetical protein